VLVMVPLVFILIALNPPRVLFLMAFLYAVSGPAVMLWRLWQRRRSPAPETD
jgi:CDP-diacylglycerol---serine O-phosphatidyltransferase